jgi:hypothetical protein
VPLRRQIQPWLNEVGSPIIDQRLGSPLSAIQTGSAFVCRSRVGGSLTKISEHARGNALDLMRFDLKNKQHVTVEEMPTGNYAAALSGLRSSACGYFTTVLGPGSNAATRTTCTSTSASMVSQPITGSANRKASGSREGHH